MRLIGTYSNAGLQATADAALAFYERRPDLHTSGLSFGDDPGNPRKVSTDISLVWVDLNRFVPPDQSRFLCLT